MTLDEKIKKASDYLILLQNPDGHWRGELEGDSILESEYALLLYFLGKGKEEKFKKLANSVREKQEKTGGWANFPNGPTDPSASSKAYFVLLLAGDDRTAPHMTMAREAIRKVGGVDASNSYTKILLAIFGVYPWKFAPAVPPEIILLPNWLYFNIYAMASWSRTIVAPLSIIWANKPSIFVGSQFGIEDIRLKKEERPTIKELKGLEHRVWQTVFIFVDKVIKFFESAGVKPFRKLAIKKTGAWIRERLKNSDGLGAIFPSILNTIIAFTSMGESIYGDVVKSQLQELEKLEVEEGEKIHLEPCLSPVWDTALALATFIDVGYEKNKTVIDKGAKWLLGKEVKSAGDWQKGAENGADPGGWYFEYANEFYPDCDDTAEIIYVLSKIKFADRDLEKDKKETIKRAVKWQMAMQSDNGGWGAFDKNCDHKILEYVPFADHNAMIDPPTVDVSSRSVEALLAVGITPNNKFVKKAVGFLLGEQKEDGSWYGRWGVNYIYGTWLALSALSSVGLTVKDGSVKRGVEWLVSVQKENGSWGESLYSYYDESKKTDGDASATQTAWALMGLIKSGAYKTAFGREAIEKGVVYLLENTNKDGSWDDKNWTGTGFPKVFYLNYHMYPKYFPLQALALYKKLCK